MILPALLAALVVGTWNGNWFPSGRAEHRAHPAVEAATVKAAAKMLAAGLEAVDPEGTNDVVLVLNEMRGPRVVSNLVAAIGRPNLRLAAISGYRRRDRYDQQQDAIATTLPVVKSGWSNWRFQRNYGKAVPPRGYAFAAVVVDPAITASVYAVHLKANYGASQNEEEKRLNREKRTHAVEQLLTVSEKCPYAVLAGDFNADRWRREFSEERIFPLLEDAGFANALSLLPARSRGTHPNRKYGDSALDYVMFRGFVALERPKIVPNEDLSDHQALFVVIKADEMSKGESR